MRNAKKTIITIAIAAVVIFLLWVYAEFDPADSAIGRFFPKCLVKQLTGLQCPACGLQRAAHSLLGGDVEGALSQNWFVLFSFGYLGMVLISKAILPRMPGMYRFFWGRRGCMLYVALYCAWFVVRNLLGV